MKSSKGSTVIAVALLCLPFLALGQQLSTSPHPDPMERFFGAWELHMKEGPGVPQRESLKFERNEDGVRITYLVAFDNGTVLHYSGVMDPSGDFVQMRQTDGKPMNEEWRVVSVDGDALIIETRPFGGKNRYHLSADGQFMQMSRLTATVMGNALSPDLTFQRLK